MVVVEEDLREKEHTGGHGHDEPSASAISEFDMSSDAGHGHGHGSDSDSSHHQASSSATHSAQHTTSSDSESESASDTGISLGTVHEDVEGPLNKLLSESSDLAKEIRLVFQVLARREDYLVQEMEKLKAALQNAIQVLQDTTSSKDSTKRSRRLRRDSGRSLTLPALPFIPHIHDGTDHDLRV
jgi:hypothetical protein